MNIQRGVSQVVKDCFDHSTKKRNFKPIAYEDEFSLLDFSTPVGKIGSSYSWQVSSIDLSNV